MDPAHDEHYNAHSLDKARGYLSRNYPMRKLHSRVDMGDDVDASTPNVWEGEDGMMRSSRLHLPMPPRMPISAINQFNIYHPEPQLFGKPQMPLQAFHHGNNAYRQPGYNDNNYFNQVPHANPNTHAMIMNNVHNFNPYVTDSRAAFTAPFSCSGDISYNPSINQTFVSREKHIQNHFNNELHRHAQPGPSQEKIPNVNHAFQNLRPLAELAFASVATQGERSARETNVQTMDCTPSVSTPASRSEDVILISDEEHEEEHVGESVCQPPSTIFGDDEDTVDMDVSLTCDPLSKVISVKYAHSEISNLDQGTEKSHCSDKIFMRLPAMTDLANAVETSMKEKHVETPTTTEFSHASTINRDSILSTDTNPNDTDYSKLNYRDNTLSMDHTKPKTVTGHKKTKSGSVKHNVKTKKPQGTILLSSLPLPPTKKKPTHPPKAGSNDTTKNKASKNNQKESHQLTKETIYQPSKLCVSSNLKPHAPTNEITRGNATNLPENTATNGAFIECALPQQIINNTPSKTNAVQPVEETIVINRQGSESDSKTHAPVIPNLMSITVTHPTNRNSAQPQPNHTQRSIVPGAVSSSVNPTRTSSTQTKNTISKPEQAKTNKELYKPNSHSMKPSRSKRPNLLLRKFGVAHSATSVDAAEVPTPINRSSGRLEKTKISNEALTPSKELRAQWRTNDTVSVINETPAIDSSNGQQQNAIPNENTSHNITEERTYQTKESVDTTCNSPTNNNRHSQSNLIKNDENMHEHEHFLGVKRKRIVNFHVDYTSTSPIQNGQPLLKSLKRDDISDVSCNEVNGNDHIPNTPKQLLGYTIDAKRFRLLGQEKGQMLRRLPLFCGPPKLNKQQEIIPLLNKTIPNADKWNSCLESQPSQCTKPGESMICHYSSLEETGSKSLENKNDLDNNLTHGKRTPVPHTSNCGINSKLFNGGDNPTSTKQKNAGKELIMNTYNGSENPRATNDNDKTTRYDDDRNVAGPSDATEHKGDSIINNSPPERHTTFELESRQFVFDLAHRDDVDVASLYMSKVEEWMQISLEVQSLTNDLKDCFTAANFVKDGKHSESLILLWHKVCFLVECLNADIEIERLSLRPDSTNKNFHFSDDVKDRIGNCLAIHITEQYTEIKSRLHDILNTFHKLLHENRIVIKDYNNLHKNTELHLKAPVLLLLSQRKRYSLFRQGKPLIIPMSPGLSAGFYGKEKNASDRFEKWVAQCNATKRLKRKKSSLNTETDKSKNFHDKDARRHKRGPEASTHKTTRDADESRDNRRSRRSESRYTAINQPSPTICHDSEPSIGENMHSLIHSLTRHIKLIAHSCTSSVPDTIALYSTKFTEWEERESHIGRTFRLTIRELSDLTDRYPYIDRFTDRECQTLAEICYLIEELNAEIELERVSLEPDNHENSWVFPHSIAMDMPPRKRHAFEERFLIIQTNIKKTAKDYCRFVNMHNTYFRAYNHKAYTNLKVTSLHMLSLNDPDKVTKLIKSLEGDPGGQILSPGLEGALFNKEPRLDYVDVLPRIRIDEQLRMYHDDFLDTHDTIDLNICCITKFDSTVSKNYKDGYKVLARYQKLADCIKSVSREIDYRLEQINEKFRNGKGRVCTDTFNACCFLSEECALIQSMYTKYACFKLSNNANSLMSQWRLDPAIQDLIDKKAESRVCGCLARLDRSLRNLLKRCKDCCQDNETIIRIYNSQEVTVKPIQLPMSLSDIISRINTLYKDGVIKEQQWHPNCSYHFEVASDETSEALPPFSSLDPQEPIETQAPFVTAFGNEEIAVVLEVSPCADINNTQDARDQGSVERETHTFEDTVNKEDSLLIKSELEDAIAEGPGCSLSNDHQFNGTMLITESEIKTDILDEVCETPMPHSNTSRGESSRAYLKKNSVAVKSELDISYYKRGAGVIADDLSENTVTADDSVAMLTEVKTELCLADSSNYQLEPQNPMIHQSFLAEHVHENIQNTDEQCGCGCHGNSLLNTDESCVSDFTAQEDIQVLLKLFGLLRDTTRLREALSSAMGNLCSECEATRLDGCTFIVNMSATIPVLQASILAEKMRLGEANQPSQDDKWSNLKRIEGEVSTISEGLDRVVAEKHDILSEYFPHFVDVHSKRSNTISVCYT